MLLLFGLLLVIALLVSKVLLIRFRFACLFWAVLCRFQSFQFSLLDYLTLVVATVVAGVAGVASADVFECLLVFRQRRSYLMWRTVSNFVRFEWRRRDSFCHNVSRDMPPLLWRTHYIFERVPSMKATIGRSKGLWRWPFSVFSLFSLMIPKCAPTVGQHVDFVTASVGSFETRKIIFRVNGRQTVVTQKGWVDAPVKSFASHWMLESLDDKIDYATDSID